MRNTFVHVQSIPIVDKTCLTKSFQNERKEKAKQENEKMMKEARQRVKRKANAIKKEKLEEVLGKIQTKDELEDDLTPFEENKEVFEDEETTVTVASIDMGS